MSSKFNEILFKGLEDLLRNLEYELNNNVSEPICLDELKSKLAGRKNIKEIKKSNNIDGLYFYRDKYISEYLCLTKEEVDMLGSEDISHLEINDSYDINRLINEGGTIYFVSLGQYYNTIQDLTKDYLTLKLSGVK